MLYNNQMPNNNQTMPNNNNTMPNNNHTMPESGHYMQEELVMTIQNCEATCEHMTHFLMRMPDSNRMKQAVLLRECADICGLTAKFIARGAIFDRYIAALCADICESCGNECARFRDRMSQECARICLHCASECAEFADMDKNM